MKGLTVHVQHVVDSWERGHIFLVTSLCLLCAIVCKAETEKSSAI